MSYVVDVTYSPKWYVNAWCDAFYKSDADAWVDAFYKSGEKTMPDHGWNISYPDYVYNWGGGDGPNTVTFPDEQSYVWFRLRWS